MSRQSTLSPETTLSRQTTLVSSTIESEDEPKREGTGDEATDEKPQATDTTGNG